MRRIALYHFGWEHADGTPAAGNAGKAIRPALVLTAAAALGGRAAREAAVRAAAAVELVHNFTLLHDDVMDRDTTRRHRPTAWTVFGDADAILAGDALQALALAAARRGPAPGVRGRPPPGSRPVSSSCARASTRTRRWSGAVPDEVTLDEVLAMAEAKTGALLGCACALGALYAGASAEEVEALDAFGREAGLAFQLIDDVIGIWGDPRRTGKPAGADLGGPQEVPAGGRRAHLGHPGGRGTGRAVRSAVRRGGRAWSARRSPSSGRAGGTGRRSRRPTGWPARCTSCPGRSPTRRTAGGLLALPEFVTRRSS